MCAGLAGTSLPCRDRNEANRYLSLGMAAVRRRWADSVQVGDSTDVKRAGLALAFLVLFNRASR